jgi:hypothetical protein
LVAGKILPAWSRSHVRLIHPTTKLFPASNLFGRAQRLIRREVTDSNSDDFEVHFSRWRARRIFCPVARLNLSYAEQISYSKVLPPTVRRALTS